MCRSYKTYSNTENIYFKAPLIGDVRGVILLSQWIIEPLDSGKSQVINITRSDSRGRGPKWYERVRKKNLKSKCKNLEIKFLF